MKPQIYLSAIIRDMKTAILYASPHHHHTVKAIAEKHPDITMIDTTKAKMIALAN